MQSWFSEHGYRALLDRLQDGVFAIESGKLIYVNRRLAEMLGYPVEELIGRPFIDLVAPEDRQFVKERHLARLAGKKVPEIYDMHLYTAQKQALLCSINAGLGEDRIGSTVTVGSIRDVSEQRAEHAELEQSRADLKAIFDKLPDVFYRTDMQGIITTVSPSCFDLIGYRPEELLGTAMTDYYSDPVERQGILQAVFNSGGKAIPIEARLKRKDGTVIWIAANVSVRYGADGKPECIEGVARDESERKQMEEQLRLLARIDGLTGAFNRRYFMDKSEEVIAMMQRYRHPASLLIADLDHFKKINDEHGHQAGDLALKAFADACRQEIREADIFGRLGGEEFSIMMPETTMQQAQVLAERIRKTTEALKINIGAKVIGVTVSIGIAELNAADTVVNAILHRADLAMYEAKAGGRNQVVVSVD
jgi:diguanylate cyclase (GGDEF)-like protein/PAS domain S-box-containing protein